MPVQLSYNSEDLEITDDSDSIDKSRSQSKEQS
jgi:hypothetical protein